MKEASPLDLAKEYVATAEAAVGTQLRVVEDMKARGQDVGDAEAHLRELIREFEEAQARLHTIESEAASAHPNSPKTDVRRDPDEELRWATMTLARADELVAIQERRVEELRTNGQDATIAEAMLRVLKGTREVMKRNLEMAEAEIIEKSE